MVDIGKEIYTMIPRNLTYAPLLVMVHEIICTDLNSCVYELRSLLNTNAEIARFKIKNDKGTLKKIISYTYIKIIIEDSK